MDYDIEKALHDAFARIRPTLERDPDELARRRARRRKPIMLRPPRAWCLAVRACDTRLTPLHFAMVPDDPVCWDSQNRSWHYREHDLTLDAPGLDRLCRPVTFPRPHGLTWRDAADALGVNRLAIWRAIKRGQFNVRYIKGLGGVRGKPVPMVSTDKLLDPAGIPVGQMQDILWGTTWHYACEHIPPTLSQTLRRTPLFRPHRGQLSFRGWRWICPSCGQQTRQIFCPLPPLYLADFVNPPDDSPDSLQLPTSTFACRECHRVQNYSQADPNGWNALIAHLSGALLFGHEVAKPDWYTRLCPRKRAYHPLPTRAPSKRDDQVTAFLINTTMTCRQIANKLGLTRGTILGRLTRIYRHQNVHSREELRQKLAADRKSEAKAAG